MTRQDLTQDGDLVDQGDPDGGDQDIGRDQVTRIAPKAREHIEEEDGTPPSQHVDGDTGQDDVSLELEGEESHHEPQEDTHRDCPQDAHQPALGPVGKKEAEEGCDHHDAFQADVDHSGLFSDYSAQGCKEDGGRDP